MWERIVVRRRAGEAVPKGNRREEVIPKMKSGERYEMEHKGNGQEREIKVISQAGKVTSKKCGESYNVQNLDNSQISWVNLWEYQNFRLIPEEEEVLLGEFDDGRAKLRKSILGNEMECLKR